VIDQSKSRSKSQPTMRKILPWIDIFRDRFLLFKFFFSYSWYFVFWSGEIVDCITLSSLPA
jgi:hypothetical protein